MPDPDGPNPVTGSDGAPSDVTLDEAAGAWPRAGSSVTDVAAPRASAAIRILRLLGEGGMGAVYEAEQDLPHRTVALKLIRAGLRQRGDATALRERGAGSGSPAAPRHRADL